MKLLVSLVIIAIISVGVYYYSSLQLLRKKDKTNKKLYWKPFVPTALVAMLLLTFVVFEMHKADTAPDSQCTRAHTVTDQPPTSPTSYLDYFALGNYDYDLGNCTKAIADYTKSISLNSNYPESYNNRAYTYMRMQQYGNALPDLDKALELRPNYIQALMNRGDIHNYYATDRQSAILDYEKVIALGAAHGTSVCGHLFLAKHSGWNLGTLLDIPRELLSGCD